MLAGISTALDTKLDSLEQIVKAMEEEGAKNDALEKNLLASGDSLLQQTKDRYDKVPSEAEKLYSNTNAMIGEAYTEVLKTLSVKCVEYNVSCPMSTSKTLYCPTRVELVPAPVNKSGRNSKRRLVGERSRLEPPTKQLRRFALQQYPCLVGLLTSPVPAASGQDAADRDHAHFWPYMTDIYLHRRSIELCYHPRQCLTSQPQVTHGMRALLVECLTKLHRHFTFQLHTLFLTVNILDRFLATTPVSRDCFQLLGITALLITAKQEETFSAKICVLLRLCSDSYTRKQVLQLERLMLWRLQFRLLAPTALFFLEHHASERHLAAASAGA